MTLPEPIAVVLSNDPYRRLVGLLLGTGLGLAYGLVAQAVNVIALPGVPLHLPPLGFWGNVGLSVLGGAVLGLVSAWPANVIAGIALSSAVSALIFVVRTMLSASTADDDPATLIVTGALIFLPVIWINVPALGIFRWAVNKQVEAWRESALAWARLRAPLAFLAVVAAAGAFSLYRPEARQVLTRMHGLVQTGLHASDASSLPPAFRSRDVSGFRERARGPYDLTWDNSHLDRFGIQRPGVNFEDQSVVIARFRGGWTLVCLFATTDAEPICQGY